MEGGIEIIADTHEPGSLETLLGVMRSRFNPVYSTGDHIPSGMSGPDRKMVDKLRAQGVKDIAPALAKAYEEDAGYKAEVDAHYQKTIVNMDARKCALERAEVEIVTCAGNQDFAVGKKLKRYGYQFDIFKDFKGNAVVDDIREKITWGLEFQFKPTAKEYEYIGTSIILVPYDEGLGKGKRAFEEIKSGISIDQGILKKIANVERVLLLSHQSPDCTLMGLPESARDAYTEPGNRALITAYYELAAGIVGPKNVQLVHGHHHTPYKQYEFRGSKVHNLNIGDLLLVDPKTGDSEIKHVVQY